MLDKPFTWYDPPTPFDDLDTWLTYLNSLDAEDDAEEVERTKTAIKQLIQE